MSTCNNFNYSQSTRPCATNIDVGFDFSFQLTFESAGAATDLTGAVFSMTIKAALGGTTLLTLPIVSDAVTTGIYIPAPLTGKAFIQISAADTVTLGAGTFPYEMTKTISSKTKISMEGTIQSIDRGY